MRSRVRDSLGALGHEALLPAFLLLLAPALMALLEEPDARHDNCAGTEHARACPVCRSPYRFAQARLEAESSVDLGLDFEYK